LSNKHTSTYCFASWWIVTCQCKGQQSKLLMLRLCWTSLMLWSLLPRWKKRVGPTPSEFITALISKFGAKASPLVDSDGSFSWSSLGCAVSGLFMTAAGCQTM
jgi:hypothetical protein